PHAQWTWWTEQITQWRGDWPGAAGAARPSYPRRTVDTDPAGQRDDRQGATRQADNGSDRISRGLPAWPVDRHLAGQPLYPERTVSRRAEAGLHRAQHLGLLLHHGSQPAR